MKCGVSSGRKHILVGYGMPLTMKVARSWRISLGGGKIAFYCNCKRCWSPLASRGITPMGGGLTSDIWMPIHIEWARTTRRKSRASTSICGRGSSGWYVAPSVFPRPNRCTTWSLPGTKYAAMCNDALVPYPLFTVVLRLAFYSSTHEEWGYGDDQHASVKEWCHHLPCQNSAQGAADLICHLLD